MITPEAYTAKLTQVCDAAWLLRDEDRREVIQRTCNSTIYFNALGSISAPAEHKSCFASAINALNMAIAYLNKYGKDYRGSAWKPIDGLVDFSMLS